MPATCAPPTAHPRVPGGALPAGYCSSSALSTAAVRWPRRGGGQVAQVRLHALHGDTRRDATPPPWLTSMGSPALPSPLGLGV